MKKTLIIVGLLVLFFGLSIFMQDFENRNLLKGKHNVVITIKDYGKIKVELDADTAPITVTNFIKLVEDKYYDGTTFHRIIEGFMMQGGIGKDTKTIKGEFASNGVENNISHTRGTISMARSDDKNSASSQFFIVHMDSTSLDGNYAAFGHVTEGMDVVDEICMKADKSDDNGIQPTSKRPVIESIRVETSEK